MPAAFHGWSYLSMIILDRETRHLPRFMGLLVKLRCSEENRIDRESVTFRYLPQDEPNLRDLEATGIPL